MFLLPNLLHVCSLLTLSQLRAALTEEKRVAKEATDSFCKQLKEQAENQSRLQEENKSLVRVAAEVSQMQQDVDTLVRTLEAKEYTISSLQKEVRAVC